MKKGCFLVGVTVCLLIGCSHYSGSGPGQSTGPTVLACDAFPPNQPGCYQREPRSEGALNRLIAWIRESRSK